MKKITKEQAKRHDWDKVKSWNYKLDWFKSKQSVVTATIIGDHGAVTTEDQDRVYYIVEGEGEFVFNDHTESVKPEDVLVIPPHTPYNYHQVGDIPLKIILFMELWDN